MRCWNCRTHWWNPRHQVLEHSDPQISCQDWEKGDWRTWSALMASVRGCWQHVFSDQENDHPGECRPWVQGSKDRGQEWAGGGRPTRWGGAAKHLPSRSLLWRWKNLGSHSDLEHITLSYGGGVEDMEAIIRHRRIFPCALKKGPFFAATCFLHHGLPGEQFRCNGFFWLCSRAGTLQ